MVDPDTARTSYRYNALGELTCQQDAARNFSTMTYDGLGLMTKRKDCRPHTGAGCETLTQAQATSLGGDAAWYYDSSFVFRAGGALGQLAEREDRFTGYSRLSG